VLLLLLQFGFQTLPFHLPIAEDILPTDEHEQRQHDGQDDVLLAHSKLVTVRLRRQQASPARRRRVWGEIPNRQKR
jgi:hypothetical protein